MPRRHVEALERAYVAAAEPRYDVDRAIADACAHWALVRWAGLWRRWFRDPAGGSDEVRAQAFTVYRRFVATTEATGHCGVIAAAVDAYTEALQRRFPGLAETEPYPALS